MSYAVVMLGGGIGSVLRFALSNFIASRYGDSFPLGTLIVNISGCFAIGLVAALSDPDGRLFLSSTTRQFLMIGVMGGYTTFSSFSLQTLNLARDGEWVPAGMNILLSVVLCLIGVWLGNTLAQLLNNWR
ncbi:MAG: fluoride efflux transporter CrcB [Verrucomicrobiales bacterium]|nr:fluoride efflux transporter CrcB [Verrucomicrobiales bacterium]